MRRVRSVTRARASARTAAGADHLPRRVAIDPLLGDPERDVADGVVGVFAGTREGDVHVGRVGGHAGVGDRGLVTDLRPRVAEGAGEPLDGARVTHLAERVDRHLPHVDVRVLDGHEQRGERLGRAQIAEADGGGGAGGGGVVLLERPLEERQRARARLRRAAAA